MAEGCVLVMRVLVVGQRHPHTQGLRGKQADLKQVMDKLATLEKTV